MATHALIGIKKDNKVEFTELHYDGMKERVIPILEKYETAEQVQELINGGRILELENSSTEENSITPILTEFGKPSYFIKCNAFNRGNYVFETYNPELDTDSQDFFRKIAPRTDSLENFENMTVKEDYESFYYYLFDPENNNWSVFELFLEKLGTRTNSKIKHSTFEDLKDDIEAEQIGDIAEDLTKKIFKDRKLEDLEIEESDLIYTLADKAFLNDFEYTDKQIEKIKSDYICLECKNHIKQDIENGVLCWSCQKLNDQAFLEGNQDWHLED